MDTIRVVMPEDPKERELAREAAKAAEDMIRSAQSAGQPPWYQRRAAYIGLVLGVVILAGGAALGWMLWPKPEPKVSVQITPTPTATPTPTPEPLRKASPLTGLMVEPTLADRPIVGVVIENHTAARPQSGLGDAGVVYEALAEGGITRFLAFFLENRPASIGPVRSLRPYFNDWTLEYKAPIAHAGGSATALGQVKGLGVKSMNALGIGAPTFYRTSDRPAPHNLYTSSSLLDKLLRSRGYYQPISFTPAVRKAEAPKTAATHRTITINYSYASYQVTYAYDPKTNSYARSVGGKPHIERTTGAQIKVKNVVVLYTPTTTLADGHMQMTTTGTGSAVLFVDGVATPCTWVKDARTSRTKLLDNNGAELLLNPGNTWYSIVPKGKVVSY